MSVLVAWVVRCWRAHASAVCLASGWVLVIGFSFCWHWVEERDRARALAHAEATAIYEQDALLREWAARHGGVYVPISPLTVPNPLLAHLPERDLRTPSGRDLTLVNPAYLLRELEDLRGAQTGSQARSVVFVPMRAGPVPDDWEARALDALARGAVEVSTIEGSGKSSFLRLVRPVLPSESCAACHLTPEFRLQGLPGGLSVTVPLAGFMSMMAPHLFRSAVIHAGLGLVGLVGIGLVHRQNRRKLRETKRTLAALAKSEARYRLVVDTSLDAIVVVNQAGVVVQENRRCSEMFGSGPVGGVGSPALRWVKPADHGRFHHYWAAVGRGQIVGAELTLQRADGSSFPAEVNAQATPDETEGLLVVAVIRDITVRRKAEAELRASEERLRAIFDSVPDFIYLKDTHLRYTHVNPAFERFVGKSPGEILGRVREEVVESNDHEVAHEQECSVLQGRTIRQEHALRLNGEERILESIKLPIRDGHGRIRGMCGVSRDVTDRKRTERALREAHQRAQQLLDIAGVMILALAPDGVVTLLNRKAGELLGQEPEQVLGQNWFLRFVPGDDREAFRLALHPLVSGEASELPHIECRVVARNGVARLVAWSAALVRDAAGGIAGTLISGEDITERRQAELRLRNSEARLRLAMGAGNMACWDWDVTTDRIEYGGFFETLLGMPSEGLGNEPGEFWRRVAEEDRSRVEQIVSTLATGEDSFEAEYRLSRVDGSLAWVHTRGQAYRDESGATVRVLGITQNIDERKAAEHRLLMANALLETALESTGEGVLVVDAQGTVLCYNQNFLQMWGLEPNDMLLPVPDRIDLMRPRIKDFTAFRARLMAIRADPALVSVDLVECPDGRCFERYTQPLRSSGAVRGRIWSYRDVTAQHQAMAALRVSLQEKEALLKEIHHRVKNNLQLVSSLLRLRGNQLQNPEGKAALLDTQSRIRSMALLHEALYRAGNLAEVNLATYLGTVAAHLLRATPGASERIRLQQRVAEVTVPIDTAVPCGLLINELLMNCLKHAFPGHQRGRVTLGLEETSGGELWLRLADDGVGLPLDLDLDHPSTLGLQLVGDLVAQLGGRLTVERGHGAAFEVRFPARPRR